LSAAAGIKVMMSAEGKTVKQIQLPIGKSDTKDKGHKVTLSRGRYASVIYGIKGPADPVYP
jgi:hypothetical protein